jgi:hypothetical protein
VIIKCNDSRKSLVFTKKDMSYSRTFACVTCHNETVTNHASFGFLRRGAVSSQTGEADVVVVVAL